MALTTVDVGVTPLAKHTQAPPPPDVVTTPCDPWPRPYYLENGLRRVHPYHFTYNTYCKERWRGREVLDVFGSEFRDRPIDYYVSQPRYITAEECSSY
jgi:tRNA pseudouridine synthase 9